MEENGKSFGLMVSTIWKWACMNNHTNFSLMPLRVGMGVFSERIEEDNLTCHHDEKENHTKQGGSDIQLADHKIH